MKRTLHFLVLQLLFTSLLSAQNYQTVRSDRTAYFLNQKKQGKFLSIDSVKVTSTADSVFYPFPNMRKTMAYNCYNPYGASWIGKKVVIRNDGFDVFFNKSGDSIQVKRNARLNEDWTAYQLSGSLVVMAEVSKHDTLHFLGQLDSVKTISFQAYDGSYAPIDHKVNGMSLLLSKNFGLIRTFNFYSFPDYSDAFDYDTIKVAEFNLEGLTNPDIGVQNLTWLDVHDFQAGDEVHVVSKQQYRHFGPNGEDSRYSENTKSIFRYLERTENLDTITYKYTVESGTRKKWIDSSKVIYIYDTLKLVVRPNEEFDQLPGKPIINDYFEAIVLHMSANGDTKAIPSPEATVHGGGLTDSCWGEYTMSGCFYAQSYRKGLGGPYYWCESTISDFSMSRELVYYKKGDEEWGTPLMHIGIPTNLGEANVNLYPNPASDQIKIEVSNRYPSYMFELFDTNGRMLLLKQLTNTSNSIELSQFRSGIHFYSIKSQDVMIKRGKLIIHH